jgi:hypothetical protein
VQLPIADNLYKLMVCNHHIQEYTRDYIYLRVMAYAEVTDTDSICYRLFCTTFLDVRILHLIEGYIHVSIDIIIVIDVDLKKMSVILHIVSTIICVVLIKPW